MRHQNWYDVVIAYRIEDKHGNSPFVVSETKNHFSHNVYPDYEDYHFAYLSPAKFLEKEYYMYYITEEYSLYEYLLRPDTISIGSEGAVSFRSISVRSKTQLHKGALQRSDGL